MPSSYYPDDLEPWMVCWIEGHTGPNCRNCGEVNYRWLGYLGAIATAAKRWGVSKEEAEKRILDRQYAALEAEK